MRLKLAGQEYSLEQLLPDGNLHLKHTASETLIAKPESELVTSLFGGDAQLLGKNGEVDYLQTRLMQSVVSDFEALEPTDLRKIEALRRFKYVKEIKRRGITGFGKNGETLNALIRDIAGAINDPQAPSCLTLWRWNREYEKSGQDIRVLAPAYKARGMANDNDGRRISNDLEICQAVEKLIEEVIGEQYLQPTRATVQQTYDILVARIAQENKFRNEDNKLPTPHRNTLYRMINKLDPYEKDKARYGKRIADLRHKVNQQGVRPTRPLERVEIDDTKLDLFVIDEKTNLPIGRPWLFVAICVFTKMILGYFLSFQKPSYLSIMQCLLHSIRPKTYVRQRYPEIIHTWDAYGLPELIVVDNAKQYYSASFDEACLQLGIITQYAPVKTPYYKPSIERMFGTLNTKLLHQLPGTTFSNVSEKWDYDPKKHALISMSNLERVIHNWIIDVYHRSHHRGIDDVPARLWEIGTKNFPPALPYASAELEILLGHVEHRVISPSGIELFGLYYNDACLSALRGSKQKGEKFKVKYDPTEISLIHVYDSRSNRYLPVPAVDQDYTNGLSLWQHRVIKREARANVKDYVDIVDLCLAKDRIQKMVDEGFNAKSKSSSNVKAALWETLGKAQGRLETSTPEPAESEHSTASTREARLVTPIGSGADQHVLRNALPMSTLPDETPLGESGIEILKAKRTNSRKTAKESKRVANSVSAKAQTHTTETDTNPFLHEQDDSLLEEDLDLEGWETGHDLPIRKR
jgi:putative transposase